MTQFEVLDSVTEAGERALDTVVGGTAFAVDAVRRPRKTAVRAQRRGAKLTGEAVSQATKVADTAGNLPERVLVGYLRAVKGQARRTDVVGAAARTLLGTVNTPAGTAAEFLARIERETRLPKPAARAAAPKATMRRARATATRRPRRSA